MFKARARKGFDRNLRDESRLNAVEINIERSETREKIRRKRRYYGLDYACHAEVLFQLYIGGKKFPRQQMMTLVERSKKNRDFEDKFSRTFDSEGNTTRKLSSWRFVNWPEYRMASEEYVNSRLDGKPSRWPKAEPPDDIHLNNKDSGGGSEN